LVLGIGQQSGRTPTDGREWLCYPIFHPKVQIVPLFVFDEGTNFKTAQKESGYVGSVRGAETMIQDHSEQR
jgi:hypothetical protein